MRCMDCGRDMVLLNAIEDWIQPVLGFERETYMCPGCGKTEQRAAFNKQIKEKHEAQIAAILTPHLLHRLRPSIVSRQRRVSWDEC